ncbi:MAG: hypothetical protein ACN0LA_02135 [Candidatus Longimicrobiales bacterium M2_2A_002]
MARRGLWTPAALLTTLLLPIPACDGAPPEPVVTRDSAGVTITFSNTAAWGAIGPRLAAEPELIVGGLAGQRPYDFTTVGDARLLADGRLLVTHCSNPPELRLYDRYGGFIRNLAGPGQGPGQCNFILHSWLAGDTVLLYDPSLARVTYLPLEGGIPRVVDFDAAGLGDVATGAPVWIARLDDGSLLGRPNDPDPTVDGRARVRFPYVRLDPSTMTLDTIAVVKGTEHVVEGLGTPDEDVRAVLFSPFTHARAHGPNVYLADSEDFWIEEVGPDGTLLRRFGRAWEPVVISRGFRSSYRDRRVEAAPASRRTAVRREMARAVFADRFPAHDGEMIVDPDDNLWVGHVLTPGDRERRWSVFGPDGRWLGVVTAPTALRITDVGSDRVVGVWRDSDGTQTIRRFELIEP